MKLSSGLKGLLVFGILAVTMVEGRSATQLGQVTSVTKIWDKAPHSAFTSLAFFNDRWLCAFREGATHESPDGAIRVIASIDGTEWNTVTRIGYALTDLRDPKLYVTGNDEIVLTAAAVRAVDEGPRYKNYLFRSADGLRWSAPTEIGEPDIWLWSIAANRNGEKMGLGYDARGQKFVRLYKAEKAYDFEPIIPSLYDRNSASEGVLVFPATNKVFALLRCETQNSGAKFGISKHPYKEWEWKDLRTRMGGPAMIRLRDGRILAAARVYEPSPRTAIFWIDPEMGTLTECAALPSAGDTGYPGLVAHGRDLWVSYYSSHEVQTAIYLAKVELPRPPVKKTTTKP